MKTKYKIHITELLASGPCPCRPAFVAANSIDEAIRKVGDRYAFHTTASADYDVEVFIGQDDWRTASECVWRGRVAFSRSSSECFQVLEASM